jgi:hypothetical protein
MQARHHEPETLRFVRRTIAALAAESAAALNSFAT